LRPGVATANRRGTVRICGLAGAQTLIGGITLAHNLQRMALLT
jgi:hypothetical protein